MNPVVNPYAPGAGNPPPELAGRDKLLEDVRIALERIRQGRFAKSVLMVGLRGVGKTVLLHRMLDDAERTGILAIRFEAPEKRSLPSMLAPQLRLALLSLSRKDHVKSLATQALRALAGFVRALKVKYQDLEVSLDFEPEAGLADNGDLEQDLPVLLNMAGQAAAQAGTAIVIFIDEMQYIPKDELASLITALHHTSQHSLPVTVVGAGLPQLPGLLGSAKTYAERLFDLPRVDSLHDADARRAIEQPARNEGVHYEPEALDLIIQATQGYPYFLQEWGKHTWNVAPSSPITAQSVRWAQDLVMANLDESFFKIRFDRLTPFEKRYLRAMAELGQGVHRSGDIATELRRAVSSLGPVRASLIRKGMIYSPGHGDNAFTVPMFDRFMKRIMPGEDWRE